VHVPLEQKSPDGQAARHAPQFWGSVWKFTQEAVAPVPQAFGVAAGQAHALLVQLCPAGQTLPQLPQLFGSLFVVAQ